MVTTDAFRLVCLRQALGVPLAGALSGSVLSMLFGLTATNETTPLLEPRLPSFGHIAVTPGLVGPLLTNFPPEQPGYCDGIGAGCQSLPHRDGFGPILNFNVAPA
jgi:hypothetical protein